MDTADYGKCCICCNFKQFLVRIKQQECQFVVFVLIINVLVMQRATFTITCHLELSPFLCQACHITLLFQVETKSPPLLPTDLSLSFFCFHQTHDYYACVSAVWVGVFVCVCVCMCVCVVCVHFEMNMLVCFCKRPGLSRDGTP